MAFHNVSLPDGFQFGSSFGGGFTTVVQGTSTGHEYRLARQSQARHRYRLIAALQSQQEALALKTFALARRGALHSFRLKDWSDFTSNADGITTATALDQIIGVGDGTTTQFQLFKTYDLSGAAPYVRPIELPVAGSVTVSVAGGSPTTPSFTNPGGLVTLGAAPTVGQVVTAGFQFDVPVRFGAETDAWNAMQADAYQVWTFQQLECIEVLGEIAWPELGNPGGSTNHGATSQSIAISYGEGVFHKVAPSAAISVFLPAPLIGGDRHFVVENVAGSAGTIQLRADDGTAIGSTFAGGVVRRLACHVNGSSFTWTAY